MVTAPIDLDGMRRSVENLSYASVLSYTDNATHNSDGEPLQVALDQQKTLMSMFAVAEESTTRFDTNANLALRVGELIPGEVVFGLVVAGKTSAATLDCCRFILDSLGALARQL